MQLHLFHTTSTLAIPTSTFFQHVENLAGHSRAGTLEGASWRAIKLLRLHPPKTNMETENSHISKEVHFSNHHFVYLS